MVNRSVLFLRPIYSATLPSSLFPSSSAPSSPIPHRQRKGELPSLSNPLPLPHGERERVIVPLILPERSERWIGAQPVRSTQRGVLPPILCTPTPQPPASGGQAIPPTPPQAGGLWKVLAAGLARDDTMMMRQTMGSDYKLQDAGPRPALPGDRVGWESSEAGV